ncbi:hypothetical protein CRE_02650 [Caenorhabditis remanei]|uniref:Uncharacterized protein n=1 Tax=Caenorhabditis remanei TaxID=31234 RepID=E3NG37_CAERE|nr:hypothetical protein CRE_02650 [Caenorhabditis remanei]
MKRHKKTAQWDSHHAKTKSIELDLGLSSSKWIVQTWLQDAVTKNLENNEEGDHDEHLPQTVILDQNDYPFKYDINATDDGMVMDRLCSKIGGP